MVTQGEGIFRATWMLYLEHTNMKASNTTVIIILSRVDFIIGIIASTTMRDSVAKRIRGTRLP